MDRLALFNLQSLFRNSNEVRAGLYVQQSEQWTICLFTFDRSVFSKGDQSCLFQSGFAEYQKQNGEVHQKTAQRAVYYFKSPN